MTLDHSDKQKFSILLLAAFYIVGVIGIGSGHFPYLIDWTPLNLMVSIIVVLWNHPQWSRESVLFLGLCFVVGLAVEIIGVQTGLIFGEYHYGPVLGWKVLEVPLMIGVNWALLAYAIGASVNAMLPGWHWFSQALSGALLMVCLDFFIEPVAVHYDMWQWVAQDIPMKNYFAWFVVSLFLLSIFHYFQGWIKNKVAYYLLIMQFLFFWLLGQLI